MTLPPDLLSAATAIAWATVLAAGLMRGFSGFGSGMLMVPILSILFGPPQAVAIVILLELVVSVQLLPGAYRFAHWRSIAAMSLAATLTIPLGTYGLVNLDPTLLRRAIAVVVLGFVLILLWGWKYTRRPGLPAILALGAASGLLNGSAGIGGPPIIIFLLSGPNSARENRANIIAFFSLIEAVTLVVLIANGVVEAGTLWKWAVLSPAFVLGGYVGTRQFNQASETLYRRIALWFLMAVALFTLFFQ